ncbi:flagellar protein FlgN [bacterium]|nr:flagellar protein FlgN [bacterium]
MTSSTPSNLARLDNLIAEELAAVEDLLSALKRKQRALIESQPDELEELAQRELELGGRLAALEAERMAAAGELARSCELDPEKATLSELLSIASEDEAVGVRRRADELRGKLMEISQINEDNYLLAQNQLDYTQMVMRLLVQEAGGTRYGNDGRVAEQQPRAMLDERI